jgi:hypothetical protein
MQLTDTFEKSKAQLVAANSKAMEFAEENTKAAFAFTRDVLAAKTPEHFFSVQQSYLKAQQEAALRQAEALNKLYADWLKDAAAPVADALKPLMPKAA